MKRAFTHASLIVAAMLTVAAGMVVGQQPPAGAPPQGRPGGPGRGPGFPPLGDPQRITDNLYWLGGAGGNTAIFITANGVVLVDTKLADNGQGILDRVRKVTNKPITHIINTHTHGDHTGSNAFFPASIEIVSQENTAANMMKLDAFKDPATRQGLPDRTYEDKLTLLSGNDAIDLYYFGPAHTNGDTFVVFRNARVMHTGDAFANKSLAIIDRGNGGSGVAYGDTFDKASKGIQNVTTVIAGHSDTLRTWQDFVDYGEFNRLYLAHARESLRMNKTPEQAAAELRLPEKFRDYTLTGGRGGPGGNFGALFQELRGQ